MLVIDLRELAVMNFWRWKYNIILPQNEIDSIIPYSLSCLQPLQLCKIIVSSLSHWVLWIYFHKRTHILSSIYLGQHLAFVQLPIYHTLYMRASVSESGTVRYTSIFVNIYQCLCMKCMWYLLKFDSVSQFSSDFVSFLTLLYMPSKILGIFVFHLPISL